MKQSEKNGMASTCETLKVVLLINVMDMRSFMEGKQSTFQTIQLLKQAFLYNADKLFLSVNLSFLFCYVLPCRFAVDLREQKVWVMNVGLFYCTCYIQ